MSTTTKDYWTLTEKERAALTREEVNALMPYALMCEGLSPSPAPALDVEPIAAPPSGALYFVPTGNFSLPEIGFETEEAARAFIELAPKIPTSDWTGGMYTATFFETPAAMSIQKKPAFTRAEAISKVREHTIQKTVKERNEKALRQHCEEEKKIAKIEGDILADWIATRDTDASHRRVIENFREYCELAGDATIAARFLRKRFSDETIRAACDWTGERIDLPADDAEAAQ